MATPPRTPSDDGFSDSDQAWFDQLTGKPTSGGHPDAEQEAAALRRVLQRQIDSNAAHPDVAVTGTDAWKARQWQELQRRLQREGVPLGGAARAAPTAAAPSPQPRRWWAGAAEAWFSGWRWPAAAGLAAALVLGTVLVLQRPDAPDYPSPAVMYGETDTQTAQADNPRQAADALAAALRQAGLKAPQYQSGKTYLVDINLQPDELPLAEPGLTALGLTPRPGQTRIAIRPR